MPKTNSDEQPQSEQSKAIVGEEIKPEMQKSTIEDEIQPEMPKVNDDGEAKNDLQEEIQTPASKKRHFDEVTNLEAAKSSDENLTD